MSSDKLLFCFIYTNHLLRKTFHQRDLNEGRQIKEKGRKIWKKNSSKIWSYGLALTHYLWKASGPGIVPKTHLISSSKSNFYGFPSLSRFLCMKEQLKVYSGIFLLRMYRLNWRHGTWRGVDRKQSPHDQALQRLTFQCSFVISRIILVVYLGAYLFLNLCMVWEHILDSLLYILLVTVN